MSLGHGAVRSGLNDDENSKVALTNTSAPLLQGTWVRGSQEVDWKSSDNGSGLRDERLRIDGSDRYLIDYQALGQYNATSTQTNGEFSRVYQPCREKSPASPASPRLLPQARSTRLPGFWPKASEHARVC